MRALSASQNNPLADWLIFGQRLYSLVPVVYGAPMTDEIFPRPASYRQSRRILDKKGRKFIRLTEPHGENLIEALARFCQQWGTTMTYGTVPEHEVLVTVQLARGLSHEAYEITTSEAGYKLSAGDECGLYRGLSSLTQILQWAQAPFVTIEDQPDFKHRGVMLDISRCKVPTLETLKTLIDQFALAKFNQLQLYTEHTFAFSGHQTVWAEASPLSANDILELKHFAAARYIELVPNLNCFGHFERWLRHPEYFKYAECPDGFVHPLSGQPMPHGSTLQPGKQSLRLVDELHAEYLPLFDSEFFNIGGDEPWELGLGRSKALCDKTSTTGVYLDFLSKIQTLVEKRGRQMMFWSDIVLKDPTSLSQLSRELIALNWGYEGNHPFAKESELVARQKIPFYVCPGTSSWNSLIGRTDNMRRNITSAAKHGLTHGAEGLLVTDWGDHGHHQYLPISYPGFALAACESWRQGSVKTNQLPAMVNRLFLQEPGPGTAETLLDLGRVLNLVQSPLRNATVFNRLLFWQMQHEPSATVKLTDKQLVTSLITLAELSARRKGPDSLINAELDNAIAMARHGIERLLFFRQSPGYCTAQSRRQLQRDIKVIKHEHEALWLRRNRHGGLRESVAHLSRAETPLFID